MPASYTTPPGPSEYAPYYAKYISRVPPGDIVSLLASQHADTLSLLRSLSEESATYRYAPDKWSIKQVVGHMIDTERVFAYRTLVFSRNDAVSLPGFDQDAYVAAADFDAQPLADLLDDFRAVRGATVSLVRNMTDEMMERRGTASDAMVTVRALVYIIAGHERHHVAILRKKYLPGI